MITLSQIKAGRQRPTNVDEYINYDGLIYCTKCKTPKQRIVTYYDIEYVCPVMCKCEEESYNQAQAEEAERNHKMMIEYARAQSIPNTAHSLFRFENDDGATPQTANICKNYCEHFGEMKADGQGLILLGNVGSGKTFYAMCIANELINKGYSIFCVSAAEITRIGLSFEKSDLSLQTLYNKDAIFIDDIGVERATEYALENIYRFIDYCYANNKCVIITTNIPLKQIKDLANGTTDVVSARIYSRILEMCFPVQLSDTNRRTGKIISRFKKTKDLLLGTNKGV